MQRPLPFGIVGQSAEDRFCARMNGAVGFNESNGGIELSLWNFWKARGNLRVLRGQIIHRVTRNLPPAANPERAEIAVAVENHQRLRWRRGDVKAALHGQTLNHCRDKTQLRPLQGLVNNLNA